MVLVRLENLVNVDVFEHFLDRPGTLIHKVLEYHPLNIADNIFVTLLFPPAFIL
jgi:hypothetical protein